MSELCRVVEEAKFNAREKRYGSTAQQKPQPWIVLKLVVFLTFGIMGYAGYVYIGRFCVEAILGRKAGMSRGTGIALLVVFCLLYLWMIWAYFIIIITPPGYAKDYVQKSPSPISPAIQPSNQAANGPANGQQRIGSLVEYHNQQERNRDSIGGPSWEDMQFSDETYPPQREAGILNSLPRPHPQGLVEAAATLVPEGGAVTDGKGKGGLSRKQLRIKRALKKAEENNVYRRPSTIPVLLPEHRYCYKDGFVKPYRSHHCRACGTCVLRYDHHCPWIGQCVGARNHKFFVNFNQATSIFTAFTLSTLIAFSVPNEFSDGSIDVHIIVIIALSGLFFIFTAALLISHTHLLSISQTTVESLIYRSMTEREDAQLARAFSFWDISSKTKVRKVWDQEWGRIGREGNIWWLGSSMKGWEETMGSSTRTEENPYGWLAWVLPLRLRRNMDDWGLMYEVNPRFDKHGRWRRRVEWPEELR